MFSRRTLAAAGLAVLAAAPLARAGRALPAGCDGRRAVVHGSERATPALICSTTTGFAANESHVNVLPDGTMVFTPAVVPQGTLGIGQLPGDQLPAQSNASPASLAMSRDAVHWSLVKPAGASWNPNDHGDYVDPVTGRLFFENFGPIPLVPAYGQNQEGPAHMLMSPDRGKTWQHTVIEDTLFPENAQYAAGSPPAGGDHPVGYPRVTYFCANVTIGFTSPLIAQRSCYRSLDGGRSWSPRSVILRSSAPIHPECTPYGESLSALDGHYPQAARDGSLYLLIACGPHTFLAKSTDEALTFPVLQYREQPRSIPIAAAQTPDFSSSALQVLADGTLVVISHEAKRLLLLVSADEGRSWSRPRDVTAPGVAGAATWSVAVRGQTLALAYLGQRAGRTDWNGYVASIRVSRTQLMQSLMTVQSGLVSTVPMFYGADATGTPGVMGAGHIYGPGGIALPFPPPLDNGTTGNDFLGAAVGPDGTAYGSFTQDCGPTPSSPGCVANGGQTRGILGRLVPR